MLRTSVRNFRPAVYYSSDSSGGGGGKGRVRDGGDTAGQRQQRVRWINFELSPNSVTAGNTVCHAGPRDVMVHIEPGTNINSDLCASIRTAALDLHRLYIGSGGLVNPGGPL